MNAQRFLSHRLAVTMTVAAIILIATTVAGATEPRPQVPMTAGFTYQGRLADDGGDPIDDYCDFQFELWDDPNAGSPIGPALNLPGVAVVDGLFTVRLNFGNVFDGTALWLDVAVRCSGDPDYTKLSPRQALTAAPYAAYALNADMVDGSHASDLAPAGHNHWGESWSGDGTGLTLSGGTVGITATGTTYGVYGQSNSINGHGVYGYTPADSGYSFGVYGRSDSFYGRGVYGWAASYSGYTAGVYGRSESTQGRGVIGYSSSHIGDTIGVHGRSSSGAGLGVYGWADASWGTTAGVYGRSDSDDGFGVAGDNWGYGGVGVGAWSFSGNLIEAYHGYYPGGSLEFYVENDGDVYANGTYHSFKRTGNAGSAEYRTLYGMMSAEAWIEDFGRATLQDGTATVTIDPLFAQTVNLALEYHIYLTPICRDLVVLAVTDQQPDSFTVQGATLDGKPSGCAFDYRIVAKQRGYEDQRLEKIDIPEPVEVDRDGSPASGGAGAEPGGGR